MKKNVIFLLFSLVVFNATSQVIRMVAGDTKIKYVQSNNGGTTSDIRKITFKIEQHCPPGAACADTPLTFNIINAAGNSINPSIVSTTPHYRVLATDLRQKRDTVEISLYILLNGTTFTIEESFDISIAGQPASDPHHRVHVVKNDSPVAAAPTQDSIDNVTFLNGFNFNFDGNTSSNYVGSLNVFAPDLAWTWGADKMKRVGVNFGAFKVDYSKRGDSINNSFNVVEYVKFQPLDSMIPGKKYLRQYNRFSTTAKNSTLSLYLQPLVRLLGKNKVIMYGNFHFELLMSKWKTDITVANIQQDTVIVTGDTKIYTIQHMNRLSGASNNTYSSSSSYTAISEQVGVGLTFLVKPVKSVVLSVQTNYGFAINYGQPTGVNREAFVTRYDDFRRQFYLFRASMQYNLSKSLKVCLGTEFRGLAPLKGEAPESPAQAFYLGLNLGLDAFADIIKK
ncbi:MAG TPA: hypothetical protein VGF30_08005 [Bacteroidia bacterium]